MSVVLIFFSFSSTDVVFAPHAATFTIAAPVKLAAATPAWREKTYARERGEEKEKYIRMADISGC